MPQSRLMLASKLSPVWRGVARRFAEKCGKCGQPRLYSVFDAYVSGAKPDCSGCSAAYRAARPLMRRVFRGVGANEDEVRSLFADHLVRRSTLNVVKGISHFGLRSPQPTGVPVVIVWNYTNKCNLGCLHCHQNSGGAAEKELTTGESLEVIRKIGDGGISILTFSGGEPLLRPDIFEAVRLADEMGVLCTVASNATLMRKEVVEGLRKSGVRRVEVGLDGCKAETHDFLRNAPGAFEATIRGIENCVEAGFDEVCATMTLHSKNLGELRGTVELAERLGVGRFYLNRLIPAGRGRDVMQLDVTNAEKIEALEYIYKKFYDSALSGSGIQCYARGMTYYGRLGHERSKGTVFTVSEALSGFSRMWQGKLGELMPKLVSRLASGFGGCSAGITYAGLTAGGDLLPCVPAPIKLGNLLEEDLEDIWVNSETLNYLRRRDNLKGACGRCAYRRICGGCRFTAYITKGDWLEEDTSCPFGPSLKVER